MTNVFVFEIINPLMIANRFDRRSDHLAHPLSASL